MQEQIGVYKALEKIGEGGMGEVYRGLDTMLEREVAIKQLRTEFAGNSDIVERFRSEAVTLAKLNHPNIVTLYSFLREAGGLYMVLEFVRGETLDQIIRRRGALPWPEAVSLIVQALHGLEHAHQMQVIHRDLKPANIILTTGGVLKLMDFGIARILNTARQTRVGHLIGTLQYMSPEQVKGGEGDGRSDLYSLAIVLYEMLAGRVPFDGDTDYDLIRAQVETTAPPLESFGVAIPAALAKLLTRALAKTPGERFQSAGELAQALEAVLANTEAPGAQAKVANGAAAGLQPTGTAAIPSATAAAAKDPGGFVGFLKNNPIVAAAAVMVVIGLALLFAARGERPSGEADTKGERKEPASTVAVPNKPVAVDGPSATFSMPEESKIILPLPSELPKPPVEAAPPVTKAAPPPPGPPPPRQPVQVTRPVPAAPAPVENYPPPERSRRVYTPPPPPQDSGDAGGWGDVKVRK